jgi:hypothetical protein
MIDFTQGFALDHLGARTKFRATAAALGGAISEGVGFIDWREATTGQAISITQPAIEG